MFRTLLCVSILLAACTADEDSPLDASRSDATPDGGVNNDTGSTDASDPDASDPDAFESDAGETADGGDASVADSGSPVCGTDRVREDIAIPTVDSHTLAAFLDRPTQPNCPLPTILLQTPYDKENAWASYFQAERPQRPLFNSPHYNYVVVDWRGRFGSQGLPHVGDGLWMAQDSYDTVEWIAAQPWSDGKVGTWGVSALCGAQYRTAAGPQRNAQHPDFADEPPPHLTAMVPIMCAMRQGYNHIYPGGVLRHEHLAGLDVLGFGLRQLFENNPRQNWLWNLFDGGMPSERMKVPALVVSGWWDLRPDLTVDAWQELVTNSDPAVRSQHRLLIGPWVHFATGGAVGEGAIRPLTAEERVYMDLERRIDTDSLLFFDHHLRSLPNEVTTWEAVRYQHENEGWRAAAEWPPSNLTPQTLYLGQSSLEESVPTSGTATIAYDPSDPSPTLGGGTLSPYSCVGDPNPVVCSITPDPNKLLLHGPLSQAALMPRSDQITFRTEPLTTALSILGTLRVHVDLTTTGADTDVAVRVLDIDATGDPRLIGDGIQRLSGRDSQRSFSEVTPGTRYSVVVEIFKDFAYTIPVGHRLGVMISASNWPLYARNPGDGAVFMASDVSPNTNDDFTYGSPQTTVPLKGTATPMTNTLFLDGTSRVELTTAP